ncbi:MAG: DNA polymerase I [Candidatus Fibromonas sp.]|jgi:DNA polymerase-1|nr:DNA polymerase I [Candidatus Fibromonas sp.]
MHRLLLIDSSALAFRMYYAYARNPLRNSKGQLVSLLHGYWGAILRIIKMHKPEYFAIVKDVSRTNFRHELYPEYKATRSPMPQEMVEQIPYLNESLETSGIPILEREGFEADDIMAAVAKRAAEKNCLVFLVTKDKDMAQIVDDKIHLYHIEKGAKGVDFGIEQVREKFGVAPEQMRDYLALVGDDSDNIPGVAQIGPKSAIELLTKYGDLDNIYKNLAELPKAKQSLLEANKEKAFLSRKLVTLRSDYDFGYKLENLRYQGLKREELYNLFKKYEVPSLIPLLPHAEDGPSLFSMLPEPFTRETHIIIETVEALQKMEEDLKSAKVLAFVALQNGAVSVSKKEREFYELPQDITLYREWLKEIFENENMELVFYNAKAVFHIWDEDSWPKGKFWDALLAQWLFRSGTHNGGSPENAAALIEKWGSIKGELKNKNLFELFENKEMPFIKVLYKMERYGIAIDNIALANLNSELQKKVAEYEAQIFEIAEERFNLSSTKQLSQILYEKLKLPVLKKSVRGPSTDAETLEMLLEQNDPHPILEPIMNWREFQKLQSTYTEALPKLLSPKTNRLHTTFLPWGTATGRLSSVNPNLQNIPVRREEGKRIRAAFVPSQKDWKIISVDYSQIELRMLAHLSGDPELSSAFSQGIDIHSVTAARIFETKDVSREMRSAAKIVNFGVIYGMSAFRLARELRISRSKAAEFINGYFNLYSGVKTYFDGVIKEAKKSGFIETIAKRRRYLPELRASDQQKRTMAERMATNSPIQGSAADLIMEAMLRLHAKIEGENLPLRMLLQVHDELVFECPKERAEEFSQMIKHEMENAWPLSVPLLANVGIGDNWLEAH